MINRRDFNLALGSLTLLSVACGVNAQGRKVIRAANPNSVLDASQAFATCGMHPRLRYYESEGVSLEYVNMNSISQAITSVATSQADTASLAPAIYLPALAKEPNLGIIAAYNWLPRNANVVVVKADSPIKSISELAGKKIGIRNQGDGGIMQMRIMFAELGLAAASLEFIAVGDSGPAGTALTSNQVDAIVTFDSAAGRIEALGFPLRYLPLPSAYAKVSSGWFGFRRKDLKDERKAIVGLCRAVAKSTLFAHTNLDQAFNLHWALYPDSKPKSKSDEETRKELKVVLAQRRDNWTRRTDDPDQRWGASSIEEWKTHIAIASQATNNPQMAQQIGGLSNVFTNELVDEINAFDKAAVIRQAREFKL